jgi:uncharacterized protein
MGAAVDKEDEKDEKDGMLAAARGYTRRGWRVAPVRRGEKGVTLARWTELRLDEDDLPRWFRGASAHNIGILTGTPSNGLVDVDCDAPEAHEAAKELLPATGLVSGRASAPASHYWYRIEGMIPATTKFGDVGAAPSPGPSPLQGEGGPEPAPPPSGTPVDPPLSQRQLGEGGRAQQGREGAARYNTTAKQTSPLHTMKGEQRMTNREEIVAAAEAFARDVLTGESSGHDWWHIARVRSLARTIAEAEHADTFICELAALLHDIADPKIAGDWESGLARVREWLTAHDVPTDEREHVLEIIGAISFAGGAKPAPRTLEGRVVQDADRLDAIGAIGIARAFAYGGAHGRILYDPAVAPRVTMTAEEYRTHLTPTINHFYEKLLLLKDRMNTDYARQLAEQRQRVMEAFLDEFYAEWDGTR